MNNDLEIFLLYVVNMILPAQILIQVHSQELTSFFQLVFTYSVQTCIIYINVLYDQISYLEVSK